MAKAATAELKEESTTVEDELRRVKELCEANGMQFAYEALDFILHEMFEKFPIEINDEERVMRPASGYAKRLLREIEDGVADRTRRHEIRVQYRETSPELQVIEY